MGKKTIIIGVGNTLCHDDGIGQIVVQSLINSDIRNKAFILDGGTDGLALIDYIKDHEKIIIVDAVNMDLDPGEIKVFTPNDVILNVRSDSLSTHGLGLAELLCLIKELDINRDIKIVGIQPNDVSVGEGLSHEVQSKTDEIIRIILDIILQ